MPADPCLALHPDDQPPIQRRCQRKPGHLPPHRDQPEGIPKSYKASEWWDGPVPVAERPAPSPLERLLGGLR